MPINSVRYFFIYEQFKFEVHHHRSGVEHEKSSMTSEF